MAIVEIRSMADSEVEAVCELIGLAFADNPSTLANVRGDRVRARRAMVGAARIAKLGRPCSRVIVAEKQGRVIGALNAAEWPRCQLTALEQIKSAPAMVRIMGSALPRAAKMMRTRAKHDPRWPHWHVGPIGVHPEHQGRGVGSALLSSFIERVDDLDVPSFLETDVDRNVVLYERFGFQVVAQERIIGVTTRFLWRGVGQEPVDRT